MEALSKVNRWATAVFSLGGAILKLLLSFSSVFALPFLWYMIITLLIFVGLRLVLFCIIEFSFTESVKIKNLKPGMLVEEHLIKTKKGYEKKEYSLFTIFDVLQQTKRGFLSESSTSLTDEDIKKIRELKKERKIKFDTMKIAKTIPFAPFMFFGVMLTYVLQGSLFYYLSLVVGFLVKFFA
jgi:prepilin signal peptidase PulO-like enzyme (type II secretory pathway)